MILKYNPIDRNVIRLLGRPLFSNRFLIKELIEVGKIKPLLKFGSNWSRILDGIMMKNGYNI